MVADDGTLRGHDPATGRERWRLELPGEATEVCAVSPRPNAAGIGAVVFRTPVAEGEFDHQFNGSCSLVGAVSLADGTLLWTESVRERIEYAAEPSVAIGETVVSYAAPYKEAFRFRAETGKELPSPAPHSALGPREIALGERYLAVLDKHGERDQLVLYESETGKELWRRPAREGEDGLAAVIAEPSGGPVVLRFAEFGQVPAIRAYDGAGEVTYAVLDGVPLAQSFVADGVLVAALANEEQVRAYDLTTGRELWSAASGGTPIGIHDGQLLTATPAFPSRENAFDQRIFGYALHDGERSGFGVVSHRHPPDPADIEAPRDLMVTPFAVDGGRLYAHHRLFATQHPGILAGYALPR